MSAPPNPSPPDDVLATDAPEDHGGAPIEFLDEDVTPGPIDMGPLEEVHINLARLAVRTISELKIEEIKVVDVMHGEKPEKAQNIAVGPGKVTELLNGA